MDDNSIMPFGKYKGKKVIEVPDNYLIWFWGENKQVYKKEKFALMLGACELMEYIEDCFEADALQ